MMTVVRRMQSVPKILYVFIRVEYGQPYHVPDLLTDDLEALTRWVR